MFIKALERYCSQNGPGLPKEFLPDLKKLAWVCGIEERVLGSGGWSYFLEGSGSQGRIFKIAEVSGRIFLEFNLFLPIASGMEQIIYLSKSNQESLHAGGVLFCYIGNKYDEAEALIIEAMEIASGNKYDLLQKYEKDIYKRCNQEEVTVYLPLVHKKNPDISKNCYWGFARNIN